MPPDVRTHWGARVVVLGGGKLASVNDWIADVDRAIPAGDAASVGALLMDLRDHAFAPTADEAGVLVDLLGARFRLGVPPLAVVARSGGQFGGARVLCTLAENSGCRASAFLTEAEAWLWLRSQLKEPAGGPRTGSGAGGAAGART